MLPCSVFGSGPWRIANRVDDLDIFAMGEDEYVRLMERFRREIEQGGGTDYFHDMEQSVDKVIAVLSEL